jgi:hypothetical protein
MPAFHLGPSAASIVAFAQAVAPPATEAPPPPPPSAAVTAASPPSSEVAPATAVAPSQRATAFASIADGIGIRSDDEHFSLAIHLLLQARYEHVERDDGRVDGFRVALVRPAVRGIAFRSWFQYFVQFELAGPTPLLLDAELIAHPVKELGVKLGQFLTPFSHEFLVPPGALLFTDFAPSNLVFRVGRDTGVMVFGAAFDGHVEYFAAAVNGNGIDKAGNDNAELDWIGRLAFDLFGSTPYSEVPQLVSDDLGLSLGVNGSYGQIEQTATSIDPATATTTTVRLGSSPVTKLGADVAFHAGPVSIQGEAYTRTTGSGGGATRSVARGGFAQCGIFVVPKTLEIGARGDLIELDIHAGGASKRVDGVLAYYLRDNHMKLQLDYAWADTRAAAANAPSINSNEITLQAQLWF